jgi:hypothetical protein
MVLPVDERIIKCSGVIMRLSLDGRGSSKQHGQLKCDSKQCFVLA